MPRAVAATADAGGALPAAGERVAVVGCGTSLYIAQAYAAAREAAGLGVSDAFAASEYPAARSYGRVVALSRSGTTSEVLALLASLPPREASLVITAVGDSPAAAAAGESLVLDFADEESVVQTRFATTALALLRASLGHDVERAADDAARALEVDLPLEPGSVSQVTFLGTGWTVGLASEAALKLREAAQAWTESYPAMEYRHGPISHRRAGARRLAVRPAAARPRRRHRGDGRDPGRHRRPRPDGGARPRPALRGGRGRAPRTRSRPAAQPHTVGRPALP